MIKLRKFFPTLFLAFSLLIAADSFGCEGHYFVARQYYESAIIDLFRNCWPCYDVSIDILESDGSITRVRTRMSGEGC